MIIFIGGPNVVAANKKLEDVLSEFREKDPKHYNVLFFDVKEGFAALKSLFEAQSLFSQKKVVVIKDIFKKENEALRLQMKEWLLSEYVREDKNNYLIVYDCAASQKDIENMGDVFKKNSRTVHFFEDMTETDLKKWINKELEKDAISLPMDVKERLFLLRDPVAIQQEIEKISAFIAGSKHLVKKGTSEKKPKSVGKAVAAVLPQEKPFELFDALNEALSGKGGRLLRIIRRQLKEGRPEGMILGGLQYQLKNLIKIRYLRDEGADEAVIIKKLHIHPFVYKKNSEIVSRISLEKMADVQKKILACDQGIKSGKSDQKTALDWLVGELIQ